MKFISLRSNFKDAIMAVMRAVKEDANLPILKNIMITATDHGIFITATNLELAIVVNVSGKIIETGKITIPVNLLFGILSNIQNDRLNFESHGDSFELKTDNYTATIQGLPADDFPITPTIKDKNHYLEIKGVFLKEAIQQVMVSAQFSDIRPELNSILFDFSIETLKLAATDGFRVSEKTIAANLFSSKFTDPFKLLVPLKTTQELLRIIMNEDMVRFYYDENQILFTTPTIELISRLSEGGFPDYTNIIPKSFITEITVSRDEFLNAVKLAAVFGQKNNELKIVVQPNKKVIEILSADQALGENNYLITAKIKGQPMEAIFNIHYLADAIKIVSGDDIFLGLQEETNPVLIKSTSDESYFYIFKPIAKI
jgi:DNA polymerase-3 subunit beta